MRNGTRTVWQALAIAALVLGVGVQNADAANRHVSDARGDAAPRIDILSARFHNGDHSVAGVIHVHRLSTKPSAFAVSFAPLNSPDVSFVARSVRHSDGDVVNQLIFFDDLARRHFVDCNLNVRWNLQADNVRIASPRSCLKGITETLRMRARSWISGKSHDQTRFRDVDQG